MRIVTFALIAAAFSLLTGSNASAQDSAWTTIYDAPASDVRAIEMFDDKLGLASTTTTLLRTTDGGATWTQVRDDLDQGFSAFGFVDAEHVWAVGEQTTIARSDDGGQTWTPQIVDPRGDLQSIAAISETEAWAAGVDIDYGDIMSCCCFGSRLLHTTDGGRTWLPFAPLTGYNIFHSVRFIGDSGWIVASPCAPEQEIDDCGTERIALLRSLDRGATWSVAAESPAEFAPKSLAFDDALVGYGTAPCVRHDPCERAVWRTTDGGDTWIELTPPLVDALHLGIAPNGDIWVDTYLCSPEGCGGALARSADDGETWTQLPIGENQRLAWDITSTHAVVGLSSRDVRRYDLATYASTESNTPIGPAFGYVSFAPDSNDVGYGAGHATRDGGRTWQPIESPAKPGRLFAVPSSSVWATTGEACPGCPNLHRSADAGQTWTGYIGPWFLFDTLYPIDDVRLWAVADNRVWRTDNGGSTWTKLRDDGEVGRHYRFLGANFAYSIPECRGFDCDDTFAVTVDGGNTWEARPIPVLDYGSLSFITPAIGFALRGCERRSRCPHPQVPVRTTDGGRTWHEFDPPSALGQFTFIDADRGWAIGGGAEQYRDYVYATADGGITWNVEFTIPEPASPAGLTLHGDRLTLHAQRGYIQGLDAHTYFFERTVDGNSGSITGPITGTGGGSSPSSRTWSLAAIAGLLALGVLAAGATVRHKTRQS